MVPLLLAASLGLQLLNMWLILRLAALTGRRWAWLFIGGAMFVTAVQRLIATFQVWSLTEPPRGFIEEGLIMLVSSGMATAGLFLIRPLFESLRRAEMVSRQSEEQYRTLFEFSPLPIVICHERKIEYANRVAQAIFGAANLDEIVRKPFLDFCDPVERARVEDAFASLGEGRSAGNRIEIRLIRTDGRTIEVEAVIALFLYGGALAEYIVMWDVSPRKRREEELRAREAELALVNRRHTMGEMAAELAHEINQPLYAVCNFSEAGLLHLNSGDPAQLPSVRRCLEQAHEQSTRAAQIVKNLRNFMGSRESQVEVHSLNQLVCDAFELVAIEARRLQVVVDFQWNGADPQVRVDRIQLEQVVVNLLMNAFEAVAEMPAERRRVEVTTDMSDQMVELQIADRGPGITAEVRQRIFDPFFSTKSSGMGMGLPVCRTIILQYDGTIEFLPNPSIGAVVRVQLPRVVTEAD